MALESQPKFSSPQEELEWLRKKFKEKMEEKEAKETAERKEITREVFGEYAIASPEKTLAPEYKISEKEIKERVLELRPESHDAQMEELLGVLEERGILNAISISRKLGAHIEDDFHRVLVQYLLGKIGDSGFSSAKAEIFKAVGMALFEINFPLEDPKPEAGKTFKDFISAMEQFYTGMAAVKGEKGFSLRPRPKQCFVLELALPAVGEEISFYVSVPREHIRLLEKQLLAVFPKAQIKERKDDYNIFNYGGVSLGSVATLKTSAVLPIRTYDKLNIDPLEIISNAFSKLKKEGEGATLQIIVSPDSEGFREKARKILSEVKKGKSLKESLKDEGMGLAGGLAEAFAGFFTGAPAKKKKDEESKLAKTVDEELVNLINAKSSRDIMSVNMRLLASSATKEETKNILNELKGAFLQFADPNGNSISFKDIEGKGLEKLFYQFSFRVFDKNTSFYLNTSELTTVYHFPVIPVSTPKIKYLKAKDAPPPPNLPVDGVLLGKNIYRDEEAPIYMKPDDRRRHLYLIGQTGTGKSALMKNMVVQDIKDGHGICVIDPHGEMVKDILGNIPDERVEDVIYFDPGDTARPFGLNMLDYDPNFPEQKTFVINELLEIFNKLYNMSVAGGPMFEQYFRNATMLVMDDPDSGNTLLEIERVLTDKEFRDHKLSRSTNPVVKSFWKEIAEKAGGEFALQNMVPYITNKFDTFLSNEIMRPIITQSKSSFNFRQVMDEQKVLLINLSKGRLGDLNSNLIGLIVVGKLLMAALSRTDLPESERRDFYLYIDEFQNVTTKSIATILSEARKYRLDLIVAHQFIGQLDEEIKKAVFGNVGSMSIFRVGTEDAQFLEKQVEPTFNAYDLMNVENFNSYLKLLIDGQPSRPFNIKTIPPVGAGDLQKAEKISKLSSFKYGKPRELVEEEVRERYTKKFPDILG